MRYLFMLLWVILLVLGVVFASLNAHEVAVNILLTSMHIFLPLLLVLTLMIGAFCGALAMSSKIMKGRYANRRLRKQLHKIEKELRALQLRHDEHQSRMLEA